ncbi:hypothetical protein KBC04_04035 [Candidatus Babeliales bacterium]|nr:hypothetical protein [Candidatus Babeliales bacterium]MBP9843334.1 hypothetical protein [Candidatus Babeliales bacterium]
MNSFNFITITKSKITQKYICAQAMDYDFYLLYLLFTETLSPASLDQQNQPGEESRSYGNFQKNNGIDFCKDSSVKCLATSQLFMNKNNGHIELFANYDLMNTEDLCLPKSPKFIMTAKNFIHFMMQKSQLLKQQPHQLFIVIDKQGHAHLTTDLQSITKVSFFSTIQKKLAGLFNRPAA